MRACSNDANHKLTTKAAAPLGAASAALYKWTNEAGEVVYSDKPPPQNLQGQRLKAPPPPPVPPEQALEELRNKSKAYTERREARQEAARIQQEAKAKAERKRQRCDQLRSRLTFLQNNPRISVKAEGGEYSRMNEEQRQSNIQKTSDQIQKDC